MDLDLLSPPNETIMKRLHLTLLCCLSTLGLAFAADSTPEHVQSKTQASNIPEHFNIPVLVISFFPTNGVEIDEQVTGDVRGSLLSIREKTLRITQEIIDSLERGSRYRGYVDSNATPTLKYSIMGR